MSQQQVRPHESQQDELDVLRQQRRAARVSRRKQQRRARFMLISTISISTALLIICGLIYLQVEHLLALPYFASINGINCDTGEQAGYHIHVHLAIYINGKQITIPKSIGIESSPGYTCYYWMHTHTSDGIIHIEAPQKAHNLALDDFLAVWHNGFSQLGFPPELNTDGSWKIYINGKRFANNGASPLHTEVPLNPHDLVTVEYGAPLVPPEMPGSYAFPPNL